MTPEPAAQLGSTPRSSRLELEGLTRRHPGGAFTLADVDLTVTPGECVAILGPSGSGKTTLLRLIAGLEPLDRGSIRIDGGEIGKLPPHQRGLAYVFQDPVLHPHLSIRGNIAFGLACADRDEKENRVRSAAHELGIEQLLDRRPRGLSGGERARVALAKAISRRPRLLLLDEPLAHLDPHLKGLAGDLLSEIRRRHAITTLFVTHDQAEAFALGDRAVVLHQGRVLQVGTAETLQTTPADRFTASFVGDPPMNLLDARIVAGIDDSTILEVDGPACDAPIATCAINAGETPLARARVGRVTVGFRAQDAREGPSARATDLAMCTRVARIESGSHRSLMQVWVADRRINVLAREGLGARVGDAFHFHVEAVQIRVFDAATGKAV